MAYYSIKHPVGLIDDAPIQVGKFVISCDFIIMDMEESF